MQNINFKRVWGDSEYQNQIIDFWNLLNVLPKEVNPEQRAKLAVMIALAEGEKIVGVSTAERVKVTYLNNNHFYNYRTLIDPAYRIPGLVDKMAVDSIDFLESIFTKSETDCIGVITLIESTRTRALKRKVVYAATGLTLIGHTPKGAEIRIKYFKGATV